MDKKEIYRQLEAAGQLNNFSRSDLWRHAFDAYNAANYQKKSMGCTSCYRQVLEWLRN